MKSRSKRDAAAVFVGGPVCGAPMERHGGHGFPKELPIPWRARLHRYSLRYYRSKKTGEIRFRYLHRGVMD